MEIETFQYRANQGWSKGFAPEMDSENTLILVFAAPSFIDSSEPLNELKMNYPHSKIVGCSTSGEILGSTIYDDTLSVAVVKFEKTTLKIFAEEIKKSEDSYEVGASLAKKLDSDTLTAILILSEGLCVNGTYLVNGFNLGIKKSLPITGGLAGDGTAFKKTWIISDGAIQPNHVVAIGFYGEHLHVGYASQGGWDIFGPERHITRSKGNVLYELDHKPALSLYKEYLGEKAKDLPAAGLLFPLAIRKKTGDERQLVRTILAVDEASQSLTFAGDMPEGYYAQLMHANFDHIITSAGQAGEDVLAMFTSSEFQDKPTLIVAISCVGRRLLLGERTEEELEAALEHLPKGTTLIGFYSYGELSPSGVGTCDLHNQTMTLTSFYEE